MIIYYLKKPNKISCFKSLICPLSHHCKTCILLFFLPEMKLFCMSCFKSAIIVHSSKLNVHSSMEQGSIYKHISQIIEVLHWQEVHLCWCTVEPMQSDIRWHPTKIYGPKVVLLTKIKPEYSDILDNPTHFPGPLVCRIRQVLTSCTIRHISLVRWSVGLDRFHCSIKCFNHKYYHITYRLHITQNSSDISSLINNLGRDAKGTLHFFYKWVTLRESWGRHDCIVIGFTTTNAIIAYHH